MRRPTVAKSTWFVAALAVGLGCLPVFSRPGYESALLFGLLVPPITAVGTALDRPIDASRVERHLARALRCALAHALVLTVALSLHALRSGWCAPGHDLAILLLGPIAGIGMAAFWGVLSGVVARAFGLARGVTALSVALALLGPMLAVVVGVVRFYASPVVFAFDQFVGFFAGSPYDTGFDPTTRLVTFRAGTLGLWLFLWALSRHLSVEPSGRVRCVPLGKVDRPVAVLGMGALGLFVAITSQGEALGHRSSTDWIRHHLSQTVTRDRCEIVAGSGARQVQVERLAEDCNAWLLRLERRLGTRAIDHVTAYVFDGSGQKELLMGAAHTQIAKPWRHEIYLNAANYPDDVVGHELAHVIAGLTARGPFKIGGSFGGWLPNPGLIEGMAVALAPDEDGDLTALEWSAALQAIGKLPPLKSLFSLGFLEHSGPLAYTVAGAFVDWIGQQYGKQALRRWYSGEGLEPITGSSWSELERRFGKLLDGIRLPDGAKDAAQARFARLGIYARRCPHAVDQALTKAEQRLAAGDAPSACALYVEARRLDGSELRARFGLGECAGRNLRTTEQAGRAEQAFRAIADDASLPSTVRARARERLADLYLAGGAVDPARSIYLDLVQQTFDVDWKRSLEVKLGARSQTQLRAIKALLLGFDGEAAWDLAVRELIAWSNEEPQDGIPDYLLGRNYWQRGRDVAATEHLDRALGREFAFADIRAEALRQRAVVACAVGDRARATAIAEQLAQETAIPNARRLGILRLVERCAGRLVGDDWPEQAVIAPLQTKELAVDAPIPSSPAASPSATAQTSAQPRGPSADVPKSAAAAYDSDAFECPEGMQRIRGGEFVMGSNSGLHSPDEAPQFRTRVRGFCLDRTEVSVAAYAHCVESGACSPALGKSASCNARHPSRGNHPINCVNHSQAEKYCASLDARLPTELEWEYAARGGAQQLKYPWGDASPDGHACWKSASSCPVATYAAGAFGLFDMSGNVWEWTSSDYGAYPWGTPVTGAYPEKIYRGGGWSRRFEKWMHLGLRNRLIPSGQGAHLGFRCAKDGGQLTCAFGESPNGACRINVLSAECTKDQVWNGQRCARPGQPLCPVGSRVQEGQGCVRDLPIVIHGRALDVAAIQRRPSPEFDSDCRRNQPKRPHAFRYAGGSHEARNLLSSRAGCKNRDVGVGWNSACCP